MAQYLPVLLVSVSAVSSANPAPDDSSLDTQAIGQVDYLSHDWQEEDVAKSWRNMTRRKDSIQNGARLENASWRTWWKQRNNLPTVSPETLNWLKDSDVTWLYGPLHTAADWAPPPRHSPEHEGGTSYPTSPSLRHTTLHPNDGIRSHSSRSNSPWALKPILKHRSISELLSISLPPSPGSDSMELEDEHGYFNDAATNAHAVSASSKTKAPREVAGPDESRKRPKLTHTKSDTDIHQRNPFRRDSPPLPLGTSAQPSASHPVRSPSVRSRDSSCGESTTTQRRHISFNTFVEQCIAIEKPGKTRDGVYGAVDEEDEDGIDIDEDEDEYREDEGESEDEDEDESEDDVLEMKPGLRSRSSSSRRTPSLSGTSSSTASGLTSYDVSSSASEREHVTIAPIAPTMLKTSASPSSADPYLHGSYGSLWEEEEIEDEETLFASGHQHGGASPPTEGKGTVNLVYVPPHGSLYAERMSGVAANGHAVGAVAKAFGFPLSSPPHAPADLGAASLDNVDVLAGRRHEDAETDPPFESGFDFFGGPDMGGADEYSPYHDGYKRTGRSPAQSRTTSASDLQSRIASDTTIGQADETQSTAHSKGSSGSEEGTVVPPPPSSPRRSPPKTSREVQPSSPVPVPSHGAPSNPSPAIPVPRHHTHVSQSPSPVPSSVSTGTSSTGGSASSYNSQLLEPPARGRSTSPVTSASTSGDSIRGRGSGRGGSTSVSDNGRSGRDKDEREQPRGRSRSRSIGTGGPLDGSVSPRSGSRGRLGPGSRRASVDGGGTIGLGGYGAYGLGASPTWRDKSLSPEENEELRKSARAKSSRAKRSENGADSSVSPPNTVRVKTVVVIDDEDSTPTSSRPSVRTTAETSEDGPVQVAEAEATRSLNPTPSNSPISAFKPLAASSYPTIATPNAAYASTSSSPSHARSPSDESGTLVGRAVDIVSSAKGYLGSFWGGGERHPQHIREGSGVSTTSVSR